MVGDSLLESAIDEVTQALGGDTVRVDALAGRTIGQAGDAITALAANAPHVAIISLGTNDVDTDPGLLRADIEATAGVLRQLPCVIWVDAQPFTPALDALNMELRAVAASSANLHVATWSNLAGPADLHGADGYHLSEEGQLAFANLVATAVSLFCGAEG